MTEHSTKFPTNKLCNFSFYKITLLYQLHNFIILYKVKLEIWSLKDQSFDRFVEQPFIGNQARFDRKQMKPKQNVLRSIYGTSDAFLRKRPLQICKAKSVVNFYLKKQEFSMNILNSTIRGYNYEKTIYFKCFQAFIYIIFDKNLQLFKGVTSGELEILHDQTQVSFIHFLPS